MPISSKVERRIGAAYAQARDEQRRAALVNPPPIDPNLIAHLEFMFSDPGKEAKPTNPLLGQLLIIQYGVNKVINHLKKHYEAQSAEARKAHAQ